MSFQRPGPPPPAAKSNLAVPPDPSSPRRRREGPVMRAVRHVWNVAISIMLGSMVGLIGHEFAADAIARLWPDQLFAANFARALFWLVGISASGVLFFSYYLDDTAS
jgi:hypothetical protein